MPKEIDVARIKLLLWQHNGDIKRVAKEIGAQLDTSFPGVVGFVFKDGPNTITYYPGGTNTN